MVHIVIYILYLTFLHQVIRCLNLIASLLLLTLPPGDLWAPIGWPWRIGNLGVGVVLYGEDTLQYAGFAFASAESQGILLAWEDCRPLGGHRLNLTISVLACLITLDSHVPINLQINSTQVYTDLVYLIVYKVTILQHFISSSSHHSLQLLMSSWISSKFWPALCCHNLTVIHLFWRLGQFPIFYSLHFQCHEIAPILLSMWSFCQSSHISWFFPQNLSKKSWHVVPTRSCLIPGPVR